jgi:hypothetical protein
MSWHALEGFDRVLIGEEESNGRPDNKIFNINKLHNERICCTS